MARFGGIPVEENQTGKSRFGGVEYTEEAVPELSTIKTVPMPEEESFDWKQFITQVPTLAGLGRSTAQFGQAVLEGAAGLGDILISPITTAARAAGIESTPMAETVRAGGEAVGIPQPEGTVERTTAGAARVIGPTIATMGAGGVLAGAGGRTAANVGQILTSQPGTQLAAATGGGIAASLAQEQGAGPVTQFLAGLVGGIAPITAASIARGTINKFSTATTKAAEEILRRNEVDMSGMSIASRRELTNKVKEAVRKGDVDIGALKRYSDYLSVGATPTRGRVSLNQIQITQEKNLAKMGAAGSVDKNLQALSNIERANDALLVQHINEIGAANADDALTAGSKLIPLLKTLDAPYKNAVDMAYKSVRSSTGRYAELNTKQFSETANNYLDDQMLGPALPKEALRYLNGISSGKIPFNVNTMIQVDKRLSGLARTANKNNDSEGALAINVVRKALNETELDTTKGNIGQKTIDLYNKARQMAASRFSIIDDTPALKAALKDAEPDKFVQTFITGSADKKANYSDVKSLVDVLSKNPEGLEIARNQVAKYLRDQATNFKPDETAVFSPSGFARAMRTIGDQKLKLFFGNDGLSQLKKIGRVSEIEKFKPSGAGINVSGSATTYLGQKADVIGRTLNKIPILGKYASPMARNALQGLAASPEAKVALQPSLVGQVRRNQLGGTMAGPAAGLTAATMQNQ